MSRTAAGRTSNCHSSASPTWSPSACTGISRAVRLEIVRVLAGTPRAIGCRRDAQRPASAFAEARGRVPLVVATGGLGPTHDDLTREGLADALGEALVADPALEAHLRERFAAFGTMPESNLRQALRIPSAEALPNPIGSAPGWWVDRDGSVVVLMPGVPSEMRRMWEE